MASPPNFLSFAALNNTNAHRVASPMESPFLSPFPSSPSSPGLEPRRTKSRHMDTFSFFDSKIHGSQALQHQHQQQQQLSQQQQQQHGNIPPHVQQQQQSQHHQQQSQHQHQHQQSQHQHQHQQQLQSHQIPYQQAHQQQLASTYTSQQHSQPQHLHSHHQQQSHGSHGIRDAANTYSSHDSAAGISNGTSNPSASMMNMQGGFNGHSIHNTQQAYGSLHSLPGAHPMSQQILHSHGHAGQSQQGYSHSRWDSFPAHTNNQYSGSAGNRALTPGLHHRPGAPRQWSHAESYHANAASASHDPSAMSSAATGLMSPGVGTVIGEDGDEVIATAVVVKNIPFSLKKETLLELFDQMVLPRPYAFNYHFDNGTFRGLAFANFHSPEETQHVIRIMNGYELLGRKLRVEYKKVLPAEQRERIEMQKRQKALQEDPILAAAIHVKQEKKNELDLNDPATLQIYSSLLLFRDDNSANARNQLAFPPEYSPQQRRIVHLIAQKLGLEHTSRGEGDERYVVISKPDSVSESSGSSQLQGTTGGASAPLKGSPSLSTGSRSPSGAGANLSSFTESAPLSAGSQTSVKGYATQPPPPTSYGNGSSASFPMQSSAGATSGGLNGPSLRIDTRAEQSKRAPAGMSAGLHSAHSAGGQLQPPGLKAMKSFGDLRSPSPLRATGPSNPLVASNDHYETNQGQRSPFGPVALSSSTSNGGASVHNTKTNGTTSSSMSSLITGLSDVGLHNGSSTGTLPSRQPKGPEPQNRNAFIARPASRKEDQ
ncbi:Peptidyl-prolyl cis-trans isomerase pin4 [Savitreella phatthalungensis]